MEGRARADPKQGEEDIRGTTGSTCLHMPDDTPPGGTTHLPRSIHPSVGRRFRAAVGLVRSTSTIWRLDQRKGVAWRVAASGVHVVLVMGGIRDDRYSAQRVGYSVRGRRVRRAGRVALVFRDSDGGIYAGTILEPILASDGDAGVLQPRAGVNEDGVQGGSGIASGKDGTSAEHFPDVGSDARGM